MAFGRRRFEIAFERTWRRSPGLLFFPLFSALLAVGIQWRIYDWSTAVDELMIAVTGGAVGGAFLVLGLIFMWEYLLPVPALLFAEQELKASKLEADLREFTSIRPLELAGRDIDQSGGLRFARLRVRNPNGFGLDECYVRVLKCTGASRPEYKGPPVGYHYPWSTYGAKGTLASIGRESDDLLDVAWVSGQEAAKCYTAYLDENRQKLEPRHSLLRGDYEIVVETGSKAGKVPPSEYAFSLHFGGGLDLEIDSIRRLDPHG